MPERDDIALELPSDIVYGPAPVATAGIAAVPGLFGQQLERRLVPVLRPSDSSFGKDLPQRLDRADEFPLLDSERLQRELYRRPARKPVQRVDRREGVLAARHADGNPIAFPDHSEVRDRLPCLAEQCLSIVRDPCRPGSTRL